MPRRNRHRTPSSDFVIMKASHLTSSGRKLGLKKICRDEPNCTVLVVERNYGYDKSCPAFIIGCSNDYGVKRGDTASYKIDTGMGYKGEGDMKIMDVLHIVDGAIKEGSTEHENAYTWVMK